ncbi:basic amino acid ABC transporter substrate-binding protein [Synechococcus sp. PCC 7335]|uniref:basic amino acid ABC transporter substrate-binding protein n=1 Tax=Synechococcus sp. (strain ATCC 29403 / PCC 7335) TaxID=91464 RepID=UPI0018DB8AB6|nr:basic amino acid ABC transporter substrate-binding protein [Synechococcus sp. PCC 7335]
MNLTRSTFLKSAVLAICTAGLLVACGGGGGEDASDGGDVFSVGTEPAFPPFESVGDDGELQGFDIDLMRAIGEKAGKTVEFESLPFDGLIPALQGASIDAAISGMTITEERADTVDFSDPYFKAGLAIAVAEGDTEINTLDDLEGKRIAVQIGTTGAETAAGVPEAEVSTFDSAPLALQELANGNVDAVVNDAPATLDAIATGNIPGITVVGELLTEEFYGIAMPKGSEDVETVNTALSELIDDGTYAEIYRKWFDAEPPEL